MSAITVEPGIQVKPTSLIEIRASQITKNATAQTLREVDTKSQEYAWLKKSIQQPKIREVTNPDGSVTRTQVSPHGLLNPISVRPIPGEPGKYALVDGGHRHAAWTECFGDALPIPAFVIDLNEVQTMEAQIEGNFHVKKTKPVEYTKQIKRLLQAFPLRTIEEQAQRLHMDPATLRQWFGLMKLEGTRFVEKPDPENPGEVRQVSAIQVAVDNGTLPLSAAFVISTACDAQEEHKDFWNKKQDELYDAALAAKGTPQGIAKFCSDATQMIKEVKKAFREQRDPNAVEVSTPPVIRKLGELKIELQRQQEKVHEEREKEDLQKTIQELKSTYATALEAVYREGYLNGVEYALQVDPATIAERKRVKEEQTQARKEAADEKKGGSKSEAIARSSGMFGRRL